MRSAPLPLGARRLRPKPSPKTRFGDLGDGFGRGRARLLWTEDEHEGVVDWVATDQIRRSTTTA